MFGLQQNTFTLRALGEEAFLPTTTNTTFAGFGFHQWNLSRFTPSIGVRLERAGVDSEAGGAFTTAESRSFWAPSTSMGLSYALNRPEPGMPAWTLESSAGYTERAPNYQELFANGAHEATGIFEIGNSNFQTEKSVSLELAVRAKSIRDELRIGGYHQQYSNFIALLPTGGQQDGLDVYQFGAVRARIFGVEAEYRHQMAGRWLDGNWDFEFKADAMRGLNLSTHDSLPRMIPVRGTFGVNYKQQNFSADLELQRNEGQSLLAANESATRGFTFLNAGAEVPVSTGFGVFRASLRANNLFNVDGRNHVSFLKDLAPLPGRNFVLALEAAI
jgi:iron complex outermembrane receptor protein